MRAIALLCALCRTFFSKYLSLWLWVRLRPCFISGFVTAWSPLTLLCVGWLCTHCHSPSAQVLAGYIAALHTAGGCIISCIPVTCAVTSCASNLQMQAGGFALVDMYVLRVISGHGLHML